jgi:hypothetical protein
LERIINPLLLFAAAAVGFGGAPWVAFAVGAFMIVLLGLPAQMDLLKSYRSQPKVDLVLMATLKTGLAIAGTFACAWAGYWLRFVIWRLS